MDKRIAQLLDLVKKTGDRLVIMPEEGDPFILMDVRQYESLLQKSESVAKKSDEEQLSDDIALWKQTKTELSGTDAKTGEPREKVAVAVAESEEQTGEDKYYFEPLDEPSQTEATK